MPRRRYDGIVAGNTPPPEWDVQYVVERCAEQRAIARRKSLHQRRRPARGYHRVSVWQRFGEYSARSFRIRRKWRNRQQ